MVKRLKITLWSLEAHKLSSRKGKYDTESRTAETKKWFEKTSERFEVDPDHIYYKVKGPRIENLAFVDDAKFQSVPMAMSIKMHPDSPIDVKKNIALSIGMNRSFWKSIIEKYKIPLSTTLVYLGCGIGLFQIIVLILRVFGAKV